MSPWKSLSSLYNPFKRVGVVIFWALYRINLWNINIGYDSSWPKESHGRNYGHNSITNLNLGSSKCADSILIQWNPKQPLWTIWVQKARSCFSYTNYSEFKFFIWTNFGTKSTLVIQHICKSTSSSQQYKEADQSNASESLTTLNHLNFNQIQLVKFYLDQNTSVLSIITYAILSIYLEQKKKLSTNLSTKSTTSKKLAQLGCCVQ